MCHAIPSEKIYTGSIVSPPNPRIFLSAGEASGDHYGAQIIAELRNRHPDIACFGLGGKEMETPASTASSAPKTSPTWASPRSSGTCLASTASYRRLVASIKKHRPDVAILIDFPDVNFRLARELKKLGVPVIYFVSPQLWAWKRRRLRWVQQRVDRMMVIFPFEERFYRARGVDAKFVGHPLAELPRPTVSREEYAATHGLDPAKSVDRPAARKPMEGGHREPRRDGRDDLPFPGGYQYILPVASTIDREKLAEEITGNDEWLPQ